MNDETNISNGVKNSRVLIFDFDGTLADSFEEVVRIFNVLSREYHLHEVKPEEIAGLRNCSSSELIEKFEFPRWRLPFLLKKGKEMFGEEASKIAVFAGIKKILEKLKSRNYVLGILSSNSEKNVKNFLVNNQINFFDFVCVGNDLFGKARLLRKIIKKYDYARKDVMYVGDETRDIQAAKDCGIACAAVSWGFNSRKILKKYNPDYIIDKPEDLLKLA